MPSSDSPEGNVVGNEHADSRLNVGRGGSHERAVGANGGNSAVNNVV